MRQDTAHHQLSTGQVVVATSWREPALSACSQAGLANNLNDGLAWGLLPLLFVRQRRGPPQLACPAVGVYRLWRDAGFAVAALLAGVVADLAGPETAVWVVAALTAASGLVVAGRMYGTHPATART